MSTMLRVQADGLRLETRAACAGLALACAYSGSDEYQAAVISARRKSGAYGSPHRPRHVAWAAAAAVALLLSIIAL